MTIIYVESGQNNITDRDILIQMDLIEAALNSVPSDDGEDDKGSNIFSAFRIVKEINSVPLGSLMPLFEMRVRPVRQQCL